MSNEEELCFRFDPTDEEVIKHYLIPKINNQLQYDFIVTKNVYAKEPWLLEHHDSSFFMENEWYYFTTRSQVSDIKIGCGKKANRKITGDDDTTRSQVSDNKIGCVKNAKRKKITGDNDGVVDRGNWKANSKEYIVDSETGKIIGIKQTLKFFPTKKQKTGDDGTGASDRGSDSSWIMKEFMLVEGDKFQELVVCRIQEIKKSNEAHDQRESVPAASSSRQHPINTDHESSKNEEASSSKGDISSQPERSETEQAAALVFLNHETSLPKQEAKENEIDWIKELGLSVEEESSSSH